VFFYPLIKNPMFPQRLNKKYSFIIPIIAGTLLLAAAFYVSLSDERNQDEANTYIETETSRSDSSKASSSSQLNITPVPTEQLQFSVQGRGGDDEESEHEFFHFEDDD
jgi:hypothetical protein